MAQKTNFRKNSIAVLGAGCWGTSLATLLGKKKFDVNLWEFDKELCKKLQSERENSTYLPGIPFPDSIQVTNSLAEAVKDVEYILFVVPSHVLRTVAKALNELGIEEKKVISATKGVENETLLRMSQVLLDEIHSLESTRLASLSGPSFAAEVGRDIPTTVVSASDDLEFAKEVQNLFMCSTFRVYASNDIIGVELGGSLKNVMAIAAGILSGIGWGDNTRAALVTRAIVEMTRIGVALGASADTFSGLSGFGDLVLTCMGKLSRNLHVGEEIGKGRKLDDILGEMVQVAEGVKTTESAFELVKHLGVEAPIIEKVHEVLFEQKPPREAVIELMTREAKTEHE